MAAAPVILSSVVQRASSSGMMKTAVVPSLMRRLGTAAASLMWTHHQQTLHHPQQHPPPARALRRLLHLRAGGGGVTPDNKNDTSHSSDGQNRKSLLLLLRQHHAAAAISHFLTSAAVALYVAYPVSLLLAFRISEQLSWWNVFEHHHYCLVAGDPHHCRPLRALHAALTGCGVAAVTVLACQLFRTTSSNSRWNLPKALTAAFVCLLVLGTAVFKYGVDHVQLYHPPPPSSSNLTGKVAVLTGGNRGIGFSTAQMLANMGAEVVLTCRSRERCQPAVDRINREAAGGGKARGAVLNLGSLESAYRLTQQLSHEYPSIHYLFCNAGTTPSHNLTADGLEDGFGGMHLTHLTVILGLLPSLRNAGETSGSPARVVMVASEMALSTAVGMFGPEPLFPSDEALLDDLRGEKTRGDGTLGNSLPAYGRAKLCNVLTALELNRRCVERQWPVRVHAVHSGAVNTQTSRNSVKGIFRGIPGLPWLVARVYFPLLWRSPRGGARILLCAALADEPEEIVRGGQYLDALCHPVLPTTTTEDENDFWMSADDGKVTLHLWGGNKTWTIYKDPIHALQVADQKWSKRLWNVSLSLIEEGPARDLVKHAP